MEDKKPALVVGSLFSESEAIVREIARDPNLEVVVLPGHDPNAEAAKAAFASPDKQKLEVPLAGPPQEEVRAYSEIRKTLKPKTQLLPVMEAHMFPYAKSSCTTCNGTGMVEVSRPGAKSTGVRACNCAYKRFRRERTDTMLEKGRLFYKPLPEAPPEQLAFVEKDVASIHEPARRELDRLEALKKRREDLSGQLTNDLVRIGKKRTELLEVNVDGLREQLIRLSEVAALTDVSISELMRELALAEERVTITKATLAALAHDLSVYEASVKDMAERLANMDNKRQTAIAERLALETSIKEAEAKVEQEISRIKKGEIRSREREMEKISRRIEKVTVRVAPTQ